MMILAAILAYIVVWGSIIILIWTSEKGDG